MTYKICQYKKRIYGMISKKKNPDKLVIDHSKGFENAYIHWRFVYQ